MSDNRRTCLYGHPVTGLYNECPECGAAIFTDNSDRVAARRSLMDDISIGGFGITDSRIIKLSMHPEDVAEAIDRMPHHIRRAFVELTIHAFIRGTKYPKIPGLGFRNNVL